MKRIIFYHPGDIQQGGKSGSKVRPYSMLESFRNAGFCVDAIYGCVRQRRALAREVRQKIKNGVTYDFLYCESLTVPCAMSESHRLPLHPLVDHLFLNFCSVHSIPVTMFYRDVFWRDSSYKQMAPWWVRVITVPLYFYDWIWFRKYLDHMFIPSMAMARYLPDFASDFSVSALPPGLEGRQLEPKRGDDKVLNLLYVGGVEPPTYDLSPLFSALDVLDGVSLTVCCRPAEWEKVFKYYSVGDSKNVSVVHLSGPELAKLYQESDVFVIIRNPTEYLSFAAPVKLFEAVGFGIPLVVTGRTEAARIVAEEKLGWVVDSPSEVVSLLEELQSNQALLVEARVAVKAAAIRHTWVQRCREVESVVEGLATNSSFA